MEKPKRLFIKSKHSPHSSLYSSELPRLQPHENSLDSPHFSALKLILLN